MEGVCSRHLGRIETSDTITTENEKAVNTIGTGGTVITKETMVVTKIMVMIEIEETMIETEVVTTKEGEETMITIEVAITIKALPELGSHQNVSLHVNVETFEAKSAGSPPPILRRYPSPKKMYRKNQEFKMLHFLEQYFAILKAQMIRKYLNQANL